MNREINVDSEINPADICPVCGAESYQLQDLETRIIYICAQGHQYEYLVEITD